jgi:hypothetical protein
LPTASVAELAAWLDSAIAPTDLEYQLIAEAEAAGAMERCARSFLARNLWAELVEGWRSDGGDGEDSTHHAGRLARAFFTLSVALPPAYHEAIDRVDRGLQSAELPIGWLPSGADDPALVELFGCCWASPVLLTDRE